MEIDLHLTKEEQDFIKKYNIDITQTEDDLIKELFKYRDFFEDEYSEYNKEKKQTLDNLNDMVESICKKIKKSKMSLQDFRNELNDINEKLKKLYIQRLDIVKNIGEYKKEHNLPIYDKSREDEIIEKMTKNEDENIKDYIKDFFIFVMQESKKYQKN